MKEQAISNQLPVSAVSRAGASAPQAFLLVLRFGIYTLLISLLLSFLITPLVDLSWLAVIRRCVSVAAATSLIVCVRKIERRRLRSYGLQDAAAGKKQLIAGIALGLAGLGIMLAIGLLTGSCSFEIHPDSFRLWRTLIGFLPAAILVSVLEELVFRGFLLQNLSAISRWLGVAASSALYAVVHLKQRNLSTESWMELAGLFLLGLLLAWSYYLTGQLWLGVGLHAAMAYGARVNKLVIVFSDSAQPWLVGTSRLVNGLSSWIALVIVGFLVWAWVGASKKRSIAA